MTNLRSTVEAGNCGDGREGDAATQSGGALSDLLGATLLRDGEDPRRLSELILDMVSVIQDHHRSADAREERARVRDERVMETAQGLAEQSARIDQINRQYDELRVLLGNLSLAAGMPTPYVAPGFFPRVAQPAYRPQGSGESEPTSFAGIGRGDLSIGDEADLRKQEPSYMLLFLSAL